MEYQLNIRKILDALISKLYIVVIAAIVSLIIGVIMSDMDAPDTYSATTTIYSASYISYRDAIESRSALLFYSDIINSRRLAERASSFISREIAPEQIMRMVSTSFPADSAVFTIRAVSENPETAVLVVNAVTEAFIQEVESAAAVEGARILDTAHAARLFSSGRQTAIRFCLMATAAGGALSILVIVFLAAIDKRTAFPHEVTLNGEIELIGAIPEKRI